jgi:phosphonoacetaldehyde hydrolase
MLMQGEQAMEFVFRRSYRGPLRAAILDWSGTAVDHGCFAPVAAFVEVFRRRGVPISVEEARGPMGIHKRTHILQLTQLKSVSRRWHDVHGIAPTAEDVDAMYDEFVPALLGIVPDYCEPIPGVPAAVAAMRERGLLVGSSTGYTREIMDVVVPEAAKRGYAPDSVVCSSDVPFGRPAPWMALRSAMELNAYPMAAVVKIGDTVPDIQEGLNAGMWTIGLTVTGNEIGLSLDQVQALPADALRARTRQAEQRLFGAGAHYVVGALPDVLAVLDQVSARVAKGERP